MSDSMREPAESLRISIVTRCPACHHQTLFVGSGGHLTCSWLQCPNPSVAEAIEQLESRIRELEGARDACQAENSRLATAKQAAERIVTSIATMLGRMNVPPQDVLEAEIRILKARAKTNGFRDSESEG